MLGSLFLKKTHGGHASGGGCQARVPPAVQDGRTGGQGLRHRRPAVSVFYIDTQAQKSKSIYTHTS